MILEGNSQLIMSQNQQAAVEQTVKSLCAGAFEGPIRMSTRGNSSDIVGARSLLANSLQYEARGTTGIWHPYQDSSPFYPQSSRYLVELSVCLELCINEHTCNVLVENVIFFNDIIDDLLTAFVQY